MDRKILRLIGAYMDLAIVSFVSVPLYIFSGESTKDIFFVVMVTIALFGMICKDAVGISIGKFAFKYEVYSQKTDKRATALQKIVRNITLVVWPVEVIVLLLSKKERRLGDMLAGTVVQLRRTESPVSDISDPNEQKPE